jgi:hypothetical protein
MVMLCHDVLKNVSYLVVVVAVVIILVIVVMFALCIDICVHVHCADISVVDLHMLNKMGLAIIAEAAVGKKKLIRQLLKIKKCKKFVSY